MNDQEREQFEQMQRTVEELSEFIAKTFNEDGTLKNPGLVIEADGASATPGASVRMQTNLGPKDFLVV